MSVTVVGVEKGGVGKSTLTQNLASMSASLKYSTVVLDLDWQATTSKWVVARNEAGDLPHVAVARLPEGNERNHVKDYGQTLQRLVDKYDRVFVEVGGKDTHLFRAALATADTVVVPLVPSPADLNTVPDMAEIFGQFKRPLNARVVLNMASGSPRMLRMMREGMAAFDGTLPLLPKTIGTRVSFKFAMAAGKGVHELSGRDFDAAAANEIKDLYLGVFGK